MFDLIPSGDPPDPDLESASPALLGRRALATVLDLVFCYVFIETVLLAIVIWVVPRWSGGRTGALLALSVVALLPLYLVYTFVLEWRFAQTPGKIWQGLVVTTSTGRPPNLHESATRNLLRYVDVLPAGFLLGWLLARRSPSGQRFGDRVAGTMVVRTAPPPTRRD